MSGTTQTARLADTVSAAETDAIGFATTSHGRNSRGRAPSSGAAGRLSLGDMLRTLLDRTLDAARGRFDP